MISFALIKSLTPSNFEPNSTTIDSLQESNKSRRSFLQSSATRCTLAALALTGSACGGGGGGSDAFVGAAIVNIDAVPRETDPGKRVQVTARINEVHPDGIFLKLRYPDGFSYATGTASFSAQDSERKIPPQFNQTDEVEGTTYLVFNLSRTLFTEENEGTLVLELNSESEARSGKIELDADVNDPTIADLQEFSVENPEFNEQDEVTITVKR
jgi:hypothetical protein